MPSKRVFVCSPYAGDIVGNTARAVLYCKWEIEDGNIPFAPHLHYPQILSEDLPEGRAKGIELGLKMLEVCDEIHVYGDRITSGMKQELIHWVNFCLSHGKMPVIVSHLNTAAENGLSETNGAVEVSGVRAGV